ncbi:MAG TPA: non-ribosomal peptide synthase/polyketide synthase [Thermoanaerobaculia bacterium]|nr:non-ribosomal peptide synthase/polyketide synthase [Thermoanaerobaculia bacterium]
MPEIATREVLLEQVWEVAERVISAWPLERPVVQLLEHKKNATFKVDTADGRYVLRVCDPDGYGEAEIRSEMQYLTALHAATGLVVPQPVPARDGSLVMRAEAQPPERLRWCALFRWVPGRMVQDAPTPRRLEQVGEISARLHRFAAEWQPPEGFTRPRWDAAGLFGSSGDRPVLAPGQGAPVVGERSRELLDEAARVVRKVMADLGEGREVFGLIHKDLEPDNTLVEVVGGVERVHPIDFADVGWGYYLYDIAAALLPLREKPGFAGMLEAFLRGYRRVRPLSAEHAALVETFLIARSIFSARLMTGRLWDLPHIREYAETAVPQILGGIRVFLERRTAAAAASTRTTVQVLSLLRERGVKLWAEGEKLKYSAPPGALTAELLAEIKERKTELLGFLRQGDAARRAGAPARIAATHRERPPLSFAQRRLWFIHQLFPESVEYNIARAVRLRGKVRVELLAASLREVVRRHGTLRTTFAVDAESGEPVQVVATADRSDFALPVADLTGLPAELREAEAWRLAQEDARRPFDLERGPLLRVFLLRLDDVDTIAPSTMHHVIGDGWSSGILFREMGLIYGALARGEAPSLPLLPIQYTDFAVWQREWLTGEVLAEQLGWWTQELAGAPQELALPTDRPRSASSGDIRSNRGDRRPLLIPQALAEALKAFSQAQGATLFMILLAAWNTLLCRLSGHDDVVVGSPIANRNRTEIEGLIGCFVNTLALRAIFRGNPTFREVLASARKTTLGAYAHQDLPFEKIVEELRPERNLTQTPLFQVIFTLQNVPSPDMEVADFRMTLMPPTSRAAMFDLALNMKEMPEGVRTSFMFKEDLFDGATVERLAACYLRLLEEVAADPNQRIRELPLLSPAEALQLQTWGGVRAVHEIAPDETLAALFAARVRQSPGAVAVTWEGNALTYAELNDRAERIAQRLRRRGVGPEDRVGLCAERSLELLIGMVGIAKAGAAYVPLDPAYPEERLAFLIEDAGVRVVVGMEALDGDELDHSPPHPLPIASPQSTAYVIYTSGSTGRPKGVMVTHANVIRLLRATEASFGFGPDDVWTLFHSYAFDFSVWEIWGALLTGGRLVVVPYEVSRSPRAFHALLAGERVTVLNQTPTAFAELMRADEDGTGALTDLRLVIFGGEALALSGLVPWFVRHGDETPRLVNMYGITETTVHVTCRPLSLADAQSGTGSVIGLQLSDLSVHVLDATGQQAPVGVPGEMTVGGAGLARGYLGRPELTAERFVPDPFSQEPGARLYRSGDLGRFLASGELEYLGRIDHQVKIRGFRIEPGEIEAALLALPGVRQAVVLAETGRLVAFVVPEADAQLKASALRPLLAARLPEQLVPSAFVPLDALPRTTNGKIDRRALLAAWASAAARPAVPDEEGFIAPRDPVEELLAGIFAEVLQTEGIGAQADFFALGGHSLLATQVVSRVRRALGVELPLRLLFETPTVEALAGWIAGNRTDRIDPADRTDRIGPVSRDAPLPLSFAQERLWFLDQLMPGSPIYNIPGALALTGRLDAAALAAAFAAVVRRHEGPRTVFRATAGQPFQVVLPPAPPPLPLIDLTALPAAAGTAEAARLQRAEAARGFDLASGPLFRVCLLRLAASSDETGSHLLLLTFHHIVFDGWSTGVLARELSALYDAAIAGNSAPLPELPIQYADFASWQRGRFTGATLERFVGYWRQRLTGVPPLRLPLDRPRPPVQSYSGSGEPLALTPALSDAIRRLARQRTATPFMVQLAAFAALLHRASGQNDFAVGTWVANRTRPELEGLIGFFVNNLALRLDVSGAAPFGELLEQVREVALGAYAHQELPFEKLIEDLKLPRDLSMPPVFQVVCVQPPPAGRLELAGVRLAVSTAAGARAHVDLSLDLAGGSAGPGGPAGGSASTLIYNHELFDRATIVRLGHAFERLLAAALAETTTPVSELPLLSPAEAWQLAGEWSRGLPSPALRRAPGIGFVHQLIERQVALRPDAEAVVWPGDAGGERLTYGALNARANRLARLLRRRGVGPETRVALWLPRSVDAVVSILAVLKAGGCYVPLDTAYSGERLAFMAADAQARVVLTLGNVSNISEGVLVLRLDDPAAVAALAAESDANLPPEETGLDPRNLAYVIYTSGSTGRPKGTMIEHRSLLTAYYAYERAYRLRDVTCHLQMASLSFDVFTGDFIRALGSGARLVLCPREVLLDPERLFDLMRSERVDGAEFVPAVVRALVDHLERTDGRLGFMRLLVVSSDAWYAGEVAALARVCGPHTRLIDSYGVTEATIDTTFLPLAAGDGTPCLPVSAAAVVVPIGRPLAGNEVWVLGGIDLLPPRMPGELCIGGDGVARGYLGRPELTAEKFTPHPFSTVAGARLYRAGDLARWLPDGSVEFLGRVDNQIKVRGFRIEPGEIEAALGAHPQVSQAVVLALSGEADSAAKHLVAYVVSSEPANPVDETELRACLKQRLPDYMVPAVFVPLAALPLTPNGKVDRKALPKPEMTAQTAGPVPPRGPVEELLAGIFSEVLGTGPVGAEANFFALGGHSLLATQVVSRVRRALGVELPLRLLFEAPTVALLARAIDDLRGAGRGPVLPPITRRPEGAPAPLSFAQERMWFLHRFAPQSDAYNISLALHLDGGLRYDIAARALGEIARRHEVLRTVIREDGAAVLQIIHPPAPVPLPLCDLAGLPPERRAAEARRITGAEAARPFDLVHGSVLRVLLVRLGERLHTAVLTVHHIATDGWSMSLLVREFCALYRAFTQGEPSPLAELAVQYADYAVWQRRWLSGPALDGQIAWWRQRLGVDAPPLALPADRPRSRDRAWGGAVRHFTLAPALAAQLNPFSRQRSVSLFMTLLAAWKALLGRLSGQAVTRVGTPVANRPGVEVEDLIGIFLNTLVLATDVGAGEDGSPSFTELLGRVRETSLEAHAHQDAPFDRLVEDLVRERDLSRSPLFQVLFVLQNVPGAVAELPDLRLTQLPAAARTANFDLALMIEEGSAGLSAQLDYSTDLFDATTIDRLARRFETLLGAAVAAPGTRIAELPLLAAEEAQQILLEWNDGVLDVQRGDLRAQPPTLHALFEAQARRSPGALALRCEGQELTYGELNARANRLAHHLLWLGVEPEVGIGLCADRSLTMVVGLLGILKAGGAYVPLDPGYPRERLAFLIDDAGVQVVIGPERSLARVPVPADGIAIDVRDMDDDLARYPDTDPQSLAMAENIAYVIYTSGSTGRPKGVLVSHGSAAHYVLWTAAAYAVDRHAGSCVHTSLAFDLTVTSLLTPLLAGVPVHLVPEEADLDGLARAVEATGYGFLKLTPAHLELLRSESAAFATADPLTLVVGGEALHGAALRDWPPAARIVNEYGPTEATVGCSAFAVAAAAVPEGPLPIGRPVAGARLYVLSDAMLATPIGAAGELWIGGPGLARGYLSRPDLTAERFVPNPFAPGARLYRTGDRARWRADGELEFLGRLDEQVKVRGFRIEPGEVEAALAGLPGVESAVVLARPAQEGEGQKRLVAWVVGPAGHGVLGGEDLRRQLLERLPEHMVPAVIVPLDALPLTANGKVDRKALPEPGAALPPEAGRSVAPRNRTEELLAEVWQQVLGQRGPGRIGVHDSFFQRGGDSILSLQVVSRAARAGLRFTPRQLFERPTIAELALVAMTAMPVAEPREAGTVSGPVPLTTDQERFFAARAEGAADNSIEDLYPLSPVQQGLLFHALHAPESGAYVVQVSAGFGAAFDVAAFERSWQQMADRHPVLRTAFAWLELDEPLQAVHALLPLRWERQDWRGQPAAEQDARLAEYLRADRLRGFDLTTPPLMRLAMFRLGGAGDGGDIAWRFVWSHHHAILDGWSMPILLRELFACYAAERQGEIARLPAVRPYRDYIAWLREQDLAEAEAFWRAEMAGLTTPTPLPGSLPGSLGAEADGAGEDRPHQRRRLLLPAAASDALGAFARHHQLTLNTLLQGAWALLLARHSGEEEVVFGGVTAGRGAPLPGIESMVGLFSNTLPVRVRVPGAAPLIPWLQRLQERQAAARQFEYTPLSRVQAWSAVPAGTPLFDTILTFENYPLDDALRHEAGAALAVSGLAGAEQSHYPLGLIVVPGAELSLRLLHEEARFAASASGERLLEQLASLLTGMLAEPADKLTVADLPLLTPAERAELTRWGTGETAASPEMDTLAARFEARVRQAPGAPALVDGERTVSYGALNARANRLAHHLRWLGVEPEVGIGLCAGRSVELAVGLLGILKAGGAYVPLDPASPRERLALQIDDAGLQVLVGTRQALASLPAPADSIVLALDGLDDDGAAIALRHEPGADPESDPPPSAMAQNIAAVLYTAESTGWPKGVLVTHGGVAAHPSLPFDWILTGVLAPLLAGGTQPGAGAVLSVLSHGMSEAPPGAAGELWIGGAGLARGYLNRPDLTAERFVPDPSGALRDEPGARLYRTGDRARWRPDGQLELLGRAGDRVKVRTAALPSPAAGKPQYVAPRDRTEELLAEVWLQVLGGRHTGGRIGVHDSFFQLGGDSILSLQVVSRAARAGLRITPRQLLESQTIARLAPLAVLLGSQRDAAASSRPAPLLPIQERFFAAALPHPEHYNQSLLLAAGKSVRGALSPHLLRRAIGHLQAHHGALRLRFLPPAAETPHWRQIAAPLVGAPPFLHVDLSALPAAARPQALAASADLLQASLDLAQGPILRAAFFGSGSGDPRQGRLLLIVHHLAVDGVSWRILAQDLEEVYRQLERGETAELPPRTTSFQRWAERLHEHAQTPAALAEAAWWLEQPLPDRPLPVDFAREDGKSAPTIASLRSVEIRLTAEETRALLEDAPRAYRTQVNDLLLTALVEAFAPWTGSRRLLLDLEGHGREDLFENDSDIDLSRTVGWFTSLFPVPLDLTGLDAPGAALKAVKEQLRAVPNRGIGFGIVRWLAATPEATAISRRLRALPVPEVSFNYLGQLAAGPAQDRLFRLAGGAVGATAHRAQPLPYLLEINGGVTGGQLWMQLGYSAGRHRQATIEQLAGRFAGALRALVAHCLEPGAGGVTPSDFPLAGLEASALDRFVVAGAPIEDIYPLSPLQQGMLFHALHAPESGAYVVQTSIRFGAGLGATETAALERSWQQVIDRHSILRTAFRWLGLNEPLQVVSAPFPIAWEHRDWRALPAAEQSERLAEYLQADRQRGFDLAAAPLLRLALIQLGEHSQLVWTHHHAILDGWSLPILLRELFSCYAAALRGTTAALPPVRPYRDYIAWLRQQDLAAAEAFWRAELAGFTAPTPLPGAATATGETHRPGVQQALLSPAAGDALGAFARRHQLTLNTLAQGAWALLLARASCEDDVVFGAVTAGRGAPLAGLDSMVGLFVNTLPVRARMPQRTPAAPWLLRLQESQIAARHFEHTPLAKVRAWSELPAGAPLFESILAFENYPLDEALREDVGAMVAVAGVEGTEQTPYPLTVNVQPGARWALRLAANEPRLDAVSLARLLGHLESLLLGLIDENLAELPVAELPLLAPAERQQLLIELPAATTASPAVLTELFAQRAKRSPWQPAVICRGVPLTYAELDQRSASLAGYLRRSGVGPEVRVGLVVEPSLERVVGLLGILRAGGAAVPVDPTTLSATEESRRVLDEARIALLLTVQRWQSGFSAPSLFCLDRDWPQIAAESKRAGRLADPAREPDSLAVIATASQPPGLLLSHRAIAGPSLPSSLDAATADTLHALRTGSRLVITGNREENTMPPSSPQLPAFVLDRRHQAVPMGTAGELYLAGPGLARGILDRPDLTAERFVPHPWSSEPGERLYRTGDRARRRPDGTIERLPGRRLL